MDHTKKQLLVFGYGLAALLSLVSVHLWRQHGWYPAHFMLLPCIIALIFVTAVRYSLLPPLYRLWMKGIHFIGSIITGIVLSVLFYLGFGIAGIVLRIMGKDLLDQKIDPDASSYWIHKERVNFEKEHYTRQF